jgi:hypothetical protein
MPAVNPRTALNVYRRDQWTCMMPDGRHIEAWLPPDDDWSATMDHIVPKSRGGTDAFANLRAAHRKCNGEYGDGGYREIAESARRQQMDEEWNAAVRGRWQELASLLDDRRAEQETWTGAGRWQELAPLLDNPQVVLGGPWPRKAAA